MDYRELLRQVRLRPGMFLPGPTHDFWELVAFVRGLEMGQPDLLAGFREYLVLKLDGCDNLAWSSLVIRLAIPDADKFTTPGAPSRTPAEDRAAMDKLFEVLDEFLAETELSGHRAIYREYWLWQQSRPWYDLDLERYRSSPAPAMVSLDDAATQLGLNRTELLDSMVHKRVSPARAGSELLISERNLAILEGKLPPG